MVLERWSRRKFVRTVGASACTAAVLGIGRGAAAREPRLQEVSWPRFDIDYDEAVNVHLTNGQRFDLTVTDRAGHILEQHRRLNLDEMFRLESSHFTVTVHA